ncbi:MAG: ribonuclease Z [Acidimicrobiales bacterium]
MRELVVLGTASQAPTRLRNHNGYFLRWDDAGILFDPGEGTQRQMLLAGVRSSSVTRICITHFHGDHCLGLPGVVQRLSLDEVRHQVEVHYPASGHAFAERLLASSVFEDHSDVVLRPQDAEGPVVSTSAYNLTAARLLHEPEALGWRVEEPASRTILPERLADFGVRGPAVGELQRTGVLALSGRAEPLRIEEVSVERPRQSLAFVMDTGLCDGAFELARGVDMLVCEATFAEAEAELAERFHHLTAAQAGRIAAEAGARRLVITHFSQRYPDEGVLLEEAKAVFPDVVAARDLTTVALPPRLSPGPSRGRPG